MSGRVVSDRVVCKHSCSSKMVKIPTNLVEKIAQKVHENQCDAITFSRTH